MIKEFSIYPFLGEKTFWTTRKCHQCAASFTPTDYQTQNYQLFLQEVLTTNHSHLSTIIQLTHRQCPFDCSICTDLLRKND